MLQKAEVSNWRKVSLVMNKLSYLPTQKFDFKRVVAINKGIREIHRDCVGCSSANLGRDLSKPSDSNSGTMIHAGGYLISNTHW